MLQPVALPASSALASSRVSDTVLLLSESRATNEYVLFGASQASSSAVKAMSTRLLALAVGKLSEGVGDCRRVVSFPSESVSYMMASKPSPSASEYLISTRLSV